VKNLIFPSLLHFVTVQDKVESNFCVSRVISSFIRLHLDLDLLCFGSNSSGNSSGLLNGPLVQKIRYFMAGSVSGSKDLDLLNPSGSLYVTIRGYTGTRGCF